MRHLNLALAALLITAVTAPAARAAVHEVRATSVEPPVQVAFFFGGGNMDEAEKELKEGHIQDAADTLHAVWEGMKASMKPEERERMLKLRADIARAGGNIQTFAAWDNDGLDLGKGAKFVEAIESKFGGMEGALKLSQDQAVEEKVNAIRAIFARPDFSTNPALVHYRDHFAEPILRSYLVKLSEYWLRDLQHNVTWAKGSIARGDYESTKNNVDTAQRLYRKLKSASFDTANRTIKLDEKDELAEDVTVDAAMKQLDQWLAKSNKLAAKANADRAAKYAAFKKALKGDKLKTLGERGVPDNWSGGWDLADAVKSDFWSYYEPAAQDYRWMTTYYFDGQQKLLKKDRRLIYAP